MKQICQFGFKCPFFNRNEEGEICTYPHIYFRKYDDIRIVVDDEFSGFDVETLKEDEWADEYMYVEEGDCPLVEPESTIDPIMWSDYDI